MRKVYFNTKDKRIVSNLYYDIIIEALQEKGFEILYGNGYKNEIINGLDKKNDIILYTTTYATFQLWLKGFRNFIFWHQGVLPEEDYLRFHNILRLILYNFFEKITLRCVKYNICVSQAMVDHYHAKYKSNWIHQRKFFVMPCFNVTELDEDAFKIPDKYKKNIFCYTGGMQPWQGFKKIVSIYSQIERRYDDVFLKVLTADEKEAIKILQEFGIKHFSVDCVPHEKMKDELRVCKYGFIMRDDNLINNVATPTKFGDYIASGIIPIYTSATKSFADMASRYDNMLKVNYDNAVQKICEFMTRDISPASVYQEYKQIFSTYYCKNKYIKALKNWIEIQ